jgi:hypothetical protein
MNMVSIHGMAWECRVLGVKWLDARGQEEKGRAWGRKWWSFILTPVYMFLARSVGAKVAGMEKTDCSACALQQVHQLQHL